METRENKLTLEEKKVIAEKVMGWELSPKGTIIVIIIKDNDMIYISDYNPDQDLTQFVEMIEALDAVSSIRLNAKLPTMIGKDYFIAQDITIFNWLCKHKYEVTKAVIEVVK